MKKYVKITISVVIVIMFSIGLIMIDKYYSNKSSVISTKPVIYEEIDKYDGSPGTVAVIEQDNAAVYVTPEPECKEYVVNGMGFNQNEKKVSLYIGKRYFKDGIQSQETDRYIKIIVPLEIKAQTAEAMFYDITED